MCWLLEVSMCLSCALTSFCTVSHHSFMSSDTHTTAEIYSYSQDCGFILFSYIIFIITETSTIPPGHSRTCLWRNEGRYLTIFRAPLKKCHWTLPSNLLRFCHYTSRAMILCLCFVLFLHQFLQPVACLLLVWKAAYSERYPASWQISKRTSWL